MLREYFLKLVGNPGGGWGEKSLPDGQEWNASHFLFAHVYVFQRQNSGEMHLSLIG